MGPAGFTEVTVVPPELAIPVLVVKCTVVAEVKPEPKMVKTSRLLAARVTGCVISGRGLVG